MNVGKQQQGKGARPQGEADENSQRARHLNKRPVRHQHHSRTA